MEDIEPAVSSFIGFPSSKIRTNRTVSINFESCIGILYSECPSVNLHMVGKFFPLLFAKINVF